MRCRACGGELILGSVIPDPAGVRGCEHHTFICSECHVTERRVVFIRHGREDDCRSVPVEAVPAVPPALAAQEERVAIPSFLGRVVARLRGH
jgi:hypothetical protein